MDPRQFFQPGCWSTRPGTEWDAAKKWVPRTTVAAFKAKFIGEVCLRRSLNSKNLRLSLEVLILGTGLRNFYSDAATTSHLPPWCNVSRDTVKFKLNSSYLGMEIRHKCSILPGTVKLKVLVKVKVTFIYSLLGRKEIGWLSVQLLC
jgi:hypothetical protein